MKAWKRCQIFLVAVIMTTAFAMTACEPFVEEELTGTVSIDGIAEVGEILTADTTNLNGSGKISYQWKREAGGTTADIGIDSDTYDVEPDDAGSTITVTVTRNGYYGSVTSVPTATVADNRTELTGTVSIDGIAAAGELLTANTGSLNGKGAISYQWKRGETGIGTDSDTYIVKSDDVGSTITVTVSRTGNLGSVTSNPTATVSGRVHQPYYYHGTGQTYYGFAGTEGTSTIPNGVTVTYPSQRTFDADGFFTLEGSIDNLPSYNYAYVTLAKDSDPANLKTAYFVRNNFKQRIWLRFGAGAYTIKISGITKGDFKNLDGEGDLTGSFSISGYAITFNVTNTRNEGDMRFLYPSSVVQSDDPIVTELAADLTSGLTDDTAKIKAIHDYIAKNTVYDQISFKVDGMRKKQDALTVLGTRYTYDIRYTDGHFLAVCEGYSNTFAALARATGIETRYVSSRTINHGWNNVFVNGVWKFIDVTWDDPTRNDSSSTNVVDHGPDFVRYDYFLLDTMNGVDNDHPGGVVNDERSLIKDSTLPWQRGMPDGWY